MTAATVAQPAILMKNGTVFYAVDEKVLRSLAYNNEYMTPASAALAYALNFSEGEPIASKKGKKPSWYWATTPLTEFMHPAMCPDHLMPLQGHPDRPVELYYTPYNRTATVRSAVPTADPSFFETRGTSTLMPLFNYSVADFFEYQRAKPPNELTIRRAMRVFALSHHTTRAEVEKARRYVAEIGDGRNKAFIERWLTIGGAVWRVAPFSAKRRQSVGATVIGFELWRRSTSCEGWLIGNSPALFLDNESSIADRLHKASYNRSWAYDIAECVAHTLPVGGTLTTMNVLSPSVVSRSCPDLDTLAAPVVREVPYELVSSISEVFSSGFYGGQEKGELYSGMPGNVIQRLYESLALGTFGAAIVPHPQGLTNESVVTKIIDTLVKYYPRAAG